MSFESQIQEMETLAYILRTESDPEVLAKSILEHAPLKDEAGNPLAQYLLSLMDWLTTPVNMLAIENDPDVKSVYVNTRIRKTSEPVARIKDVTNKLHDDINRYKKVC